VKGLEGFSDSDSADDGSGCSFGAFCFFLMIGGLVDFIF
jgi:hypothetical protein